MLTPARPYTLMIVRFLKIRGLHAPMGLALLGVVLVGSGCANERRSSTAAPGSYQPAPRRIVAEPSARQDVYVERSVRYEVPPEEYPEAIGYEELSNGEQVVVVEYVHTYPEEIETFPQIAWAGRTYYNVNGDFVYWVDGWGWCYYLGPPAPLVVYWNGYYPWAPYAWGVGYYGPGWYWGGVGMYGYHAYGLSVVHHNHHHHHYHENHRHPGRDPRPTQGANASTAPVVPGGSTGPVHKGEPVPNPPSQGIDPSKRTNPSSGDKVTRTTPERFVGDTPTRRNPPPKVSRVNPTPTRTNGYTTAAGNRVTVIDPRATRTSPAVRRTNPSTLGSLPAANAPRRANPSAPVPSFEAPRSTPTAPRTNAKSTTPPSRPASSPSWGSTYANEPQRSTPSRSTPSRSTPSRSTPSRSTPSRSNPSRSSAPKRSTPSRSAPVRSTPKRSSPSRSAPSRSSPSRSAPSRSSPSRSAPSRSSPSRSSPKRR